LFITPHGVSQKEKKKGTILLPVIQSVFKAGLSLGDYGRQQYAITVRFGTVTLEGQFF